MARVQDAIYPLDPGGTRYLLSNSWTPIGVPTTLTWSLVPDGLSISSGVGEPVSDSVLFDRMDSLFGNRSLWISLIEISFGRWGELIGVEYVRVTDGVNDWDDGASWGSSGGTNRGDIRISMHLIDGSHNILAYNYYPYDGDMVLDSGENWAQSSNFFRFIRNIIMHEHGHGLGLRHACSNAFANLMDPFLNTDFDGPQHDDIRGGQRQHGDPFEPDNIFAEANDLGIIPAGTPMLVGEVPLPNVPLGTTLSIDDNHEEDWFRFSLDGTRPVTVTITPVGKTYDNSPQNPDGSCSSGNIIDSEIFADLGFDLIENDGSTIIGTAATQPTGLPESLDDIVLPGAGDYYIRVYAEDSPSGSQLYTLEIRVSPANLPLTAPWPDGVKKNRYVSFIPNNPGDVAFQIEMVESGEYPGSAGMQGWVGEPDANDTARVVNAPHYAAAWPALLHVGDCEIIPVATYRIRATPDAIVFTEPLVVATIHKPGTWYYGDVVGQGNGFLPPDPGFTEPNGVVNVTDVQAYSLTAQGSSTPSAPTTWVDLHGLEPGNAPNFTVNVSDLQRIIFGFHGQRYADAPDSMDPANCP